MLITFQHKGRYATINAPLGAAAFALSSDNPTTIRVIFAMMTKDDRTAADTMVRIARIPTTLTWVPAMPQPARYRAPYINPDPFVEFVFVSTNDVWAPKSAALANYLSALQSGQTEAPQAPSELALSTLPRKEKAA
jgi:hypothetical protein